MTYQIELVEVNSLGSGRVADVHPEIYRTKDAAIADAKQIDGITWAQRTAGVLDKRIIVVPVDDDNKTGNPAWWGGTFSSSE